MREDIFGELSPRGARPHNWWCVRRGEAQLITTRARFQGLAFFPALAEGICAQSGNTFTSLQLGERALAGERGGMAHMGHSLFAHRIDEGLQLLLL